MWLIRNAGGFFACLRRVATLVLFGLCGTAAQAVVIAPVQVDISASRRVASITVSNTDDSPISFQTQVLRWQQIDGVDDYEESGALIVVPPIAEIAAGGSQIFRVTTRLPPGPQETAFRLILEDVTQLAAPASAADAMQVVLRVNHNLPIFFEAAGIPTAAPRIGACSTPPPTGRGCIRIENQGNRYVLVKSLALTSGEWRHDLQASARVLGGSWKQWEFDLPDGVKHSVTVSVDTSAGPVTGTLPAT